MSYNNYHQSNMKENPISKLRRLLSFLMRILYLTANEGAQTVGLPGAYLTTTKVNKNKFRPCFLNFSGWLFSFLFQLPQQNVGLKQRETEFQRASCIFSQWSFPAESCSNRILYRHNKHYSYLAKPSQQQLHFSSHLNFYFLFSPIFRGGQRIEG